MSVEELSVRVVKMEKVAKSLGVKLPPNSKWVENQCSANILFSRKDGDDASVLLAFVKVQVTCLLVVQGHDICLAVVFCLVGTEGGETEPGCCVSFGESCKPRSRGKLLQSAVSEGISMQDNKLVGHWGNCLAYLDTGLTALQV